MKVISCDGHLVEPQAALPKGAAWGQQGRLLILGEGYDCPPLMAGPAVAEGRPSRLWSEVLSLEQCPGAWSREARLGVMQGAGLAAEILYPTFASTAVEVAKTPADAERAATAYNGWVVQEIEDRRRLWPVLVCSGDLRVDVELAEGRAGLLVPSRMGIEDLEEAFGVAAALGVPLHWHAFSRPTTASFSRHPLATAWEAFRDAQDKLVAMILGGVFERHPKLKVVFAEMDVGWLWHAARRLHSYTTRYGKFVDGGPVDVWALLKDNVAFAVQDVGEAYSAKMQHAEANVMWGWDWPHSDAVEVPQAGMEGWGTVGNVLWWSNEVVERWYPEVWAAVQQQEERR